MNENLENFFFVVVVEWDYNRFVLQIAQKVVQAAIQIRDKAS